MSLYASGPGWEIHLGDSIDILRDLRGRGFDGLVTDPPYSSGGLHAGTRKGDPLKKYVNTDSMSKGLPSFSGDSRDQRSFTVWCSIWLSMALQCCAPGAPVVVWCDWRQLGVTTDALQAGGWTWRGVVPWVKPGARPQKGRFSAAAEYAVWGSAGGFRTEGECIQGHISASPVPTAERVHPTQKPAAVMDHILRIVDPGGVVLDPFTGSGSTGIAALRSGRRFVGIELSEEYAEIAARRIEAAAAQPLLLVRL